MISQPLSKAKTDETTIQHTYIPGFSEAQRGKEMMPQFKWFPVKLNEATRVQLVKMVSIYRNLSA